MSAGHQEGADIVGEADAAFGTVLDRFGVVLELLDLFCPDVLDGDLEGGYGWG